MIALSCAAVPLLGACLLFIPACRGRAASAVLLGTSLVMTALALFAAATRTPGTAVYLLEYVPDTSIELLGRYFVLDASSTLFLVLISVVFFGNAIYVWHRLSVGATPGAFEGFVARALVFLSLSVLAVLSNHLLAMWVFLELGTFAIAPLIQFARGPNALRAAWKYVLFSVIGLGFNFIGLLCLARGMGGAHSDHELNFFLDGLQTIPTLGESIWWKLGLSLMVFGLGTKLGLAPMYAWLPDAYDEAPPAVTTMLAAVQFNCVILALFREVGLLRSFDPTLISDELIVMGTLSIGVAAMHIIKTDNYKRLIAYASINHAGTIALGLGVGKNAGYGVVVYVVSNALVKAILFAACGNMEHHFGTKQISALRGLIRVLPFSGWAFMLGVFALLGFAPFGSFMGEVIMLSNMVEGGYLLVFFFICIVLTVILVASGRALFPMIWGDTPEEYQQSAESRWSNLSSLFFILILVSLGIYTPAPVSALLNEVAETLGGR
jgi:hydrogenase-4 component F